MTIYNDSAARVPTLAIRLSRALASARATAAAEEY